jgi:hypothetical protein
MKMEGKTWNEGEGGQSGRITYVKKDESLGPIDRIPLEVLGSSLQHLLIDTSNHLSHTILSLVRKPECRSLQ